MALITIDNPYQRIAREAALSSRLMKWALCGSVLVHLAALAVFSLVHLSPPPLTPEPKLIEVKLLAMSPPVTVQRTLPQPPRESATLVAPKPHPAPGRPQRSSKIGLERAGSPGPLVPARQTPTKPQAAPAAGSRSSAQAPTPEPPPAPAAPATPPPAASGGGDIGLGAGSEQGDLPAAGGGGLTGTPGVAGGPGSGQGGAGSGGEPSSGNGMGSGGSGAGEGTGTGSGIGATAGGGTGGGGGGGHVSRLADRKTPVLVKRVNPAYPMAAQVEGIQGSVKLRVTVTKEGKVGAIKVVSSSGDARLDTAAINAVKQWRYHPAVQDGIPREVDTYAMVTFALK